MARSINSAFSTFMRETVDLTEASVESARSSRDWLIDQIHAFPANSRSFPRLYGQMDIQYGSFARKTKIQPLDDIDLMFVMHAEGGSYSGTIKDIVISMPDTADRLSGDIVN